MTDQQSTQQGATVAGYALTIAALVVVSLGGLSQLEGDSEEFLTESGTNVGNQRPPREAVRDADLAVAPHWAATTLPSHLITYETKPVSTTHGCVTLLGATFGFGQCDDPNVVQFSGFGDQAGELLSLTANGSCLGGDSSTAPAAVITVPCDPSDSSQQWEQTSGGAGDFDVTYHHAETGLCMTAVDDLASGPALQLQACSGSAEQTLVVQF